MTDKKTKEKESDRDPLAISREKSRQDMLSMVAGLELRAIEAENKLSEQIGSEKALIADLKAELKRAHEHIKKLTSQAQAQKPPVQDEDWKKWLIGQEFQIDGCDIAICQVGQSPQYPHSIFQVGYLEKDEIEKGLTLADLKSYVKSEYGTGKFELRAFYITEGGYKQARGKQEISL